MSKRRHILHIIKGINMENFQYLFDYKECEYCVFEVEGALFWTRWLRIKHWIMGDWQR
jgi:hypothetical protein